MTKYRKQKGKEKEKKKMTKNKEPKWKLHAENNKVKPQLEYLATDKLQIKIH